ncbi:MAG TPA: porphobilinogen synthase [Aridibacter sp.]|nr:porphobilinogen synthase [Aridibacter sp.]
MNHKRLNPGYPAVRLRRLRGSKSLRDLFAETSLSVNDLVYPLFVTEGENVRDEITSMPGQFRYSVDRLEEELEELEALGINAVLVFGIPDSKDDAGSEAYRTDGIAQRALRRIKDLRPKIVAISDVCLCEYTSHGHCGLVSGEEILNDQSLDLIAKTALSHAQNGADIVAPSDMMDGRVGAVRRVLDDNGFEKTPIISYAAKFASSFYGPFRDAAGSAPRFGDRRSYQMDYRNAYESLREIELDLLEGADAVMVKPALAYLDLVRRAKEAFDVPVAAYNVSGEYSMIKAADRMGWIDGEAAMIETLTSIKRSGADIIITYFAKEAAKLL